LEQTSNQQAIELSEEQIVQYLKNHPGFFLKREDLLTELQLSQDRGNAVSLVERQVSVLRERNMDMRSRLSLLLDNAGKNDALLEKTQNLILALLEAKDLDKLVSTLQDKLVREFDIDFARLTLFGNNNGFNSRIVNADEAYQAIPALLRNNKATCGAIRAEEAQFLFGEQASDVGSAAVTPLNYGQALGVLAIGSKDSQYFHSAMGTMFLSYIANVMGRLLLPYLDN
jgi:uncharacterized protein YigA (DUF484 family)